MESYHEIVTRTMKPITVYWLSDDGEWYDRLHANEGAAVEFEANCRKRGVKTSRTAP